MSWIQRVLYGADLDEEQERQNQLDAANAALSEKKREKYGDEWFAEVTANAERSRIDVEAEVDQAFDEGLQEGADNVSAILRKPLDLAGNVGSSAIGAILKAIPWWLWLAGLGVLAAYFWPLIAGALAARRK